MLINKINKSKFLLLFLLFSCGTPRPAAEHKNDASVVFFDDFSGSSLDRSKWNVIITGQVFNNEQQAYVDSAATIYMVKGKEAEGAKNGALVIHPRYSQGFVTKDGKKFDFISGRINTAGKVDFMYGNVSARIKLSEGKGLWPAWWVLGSGRWPATGEIDIMEFIGENEWTNAAVHGPGYSGNTPFVKRVTFTDKDPVTNWHVYSVTWTPDSMVFLLDEKPYYTVTKEMVQKYGNWAFDNAKHLILNFALGGGYPGGVNKVTTPYFGLPAETVELVKQNKCRMLVDWVRITRLNPTAAQP
jgi:beta-glucanase (GH16 family)